jgi:hypothetical protein
MVRYFIIASILLIDNEGLFEQCLKKYLHGVSLRRDKDWLTFFSFLSKSYASPPMT